MERRFEAQCGELLDQACVKVEGSRKGEQKRCQV